MLENLQMSFNGQPNMFFGMFISCTCDLHLKLDILNPLNIIFFIKWFKKWVLCSLIAFSFKISRLWNFWMIWFFIKFIQWTCTFIKGGMFLLYKKIWNPFYDFMPSFLLLQKMYFIHLILLVYKTQNDIKIISKLFKNIFINLRRYHFFIGIQ
jgi:hypothetical protein